MQQRTNGLLTHVRKSIEHQQVQSINIVLPMSPDGQRLQKILGERVEFLSVCTVCQHVANMRAGLR